MKLLLVVKGCIMNVNIVRRTVAASLFLSVLMTGFFTIDFPVVSAQENVTATLSKEALLEKITELLEIVQELQIKLLEMSPQSPFVSSLSIGSKSAEVTQLQAFLAQDSDVYPEKIVSGYYGSLTEKAVKKFQAKYGIETVGFIGPQTRAKLNEKYNSFKDSQRLANLVTDKSESSSSKKVDKRREYEEVEEDDFDVEIEESSDTDSIETEDDSNEDDNVESDDAVNSTEDGDDDSDTEIASPAVVYQCSDGLDNDNDSLVDFPNDPGCGSSVDNDEYNTLSNSGAAFNLPQDLVPSQSYTVMDFEDSVLHDATWLLAQPVGTNGLYVKGKGDSGADKFSLAVGQGLNGGNALKVTADSSLPGFWVINQMTGKSGVNVTDDRGYILPRGKRANRMEFWVKFPDGYRANQAGAQPPKYPNHQNMHFGTYQYDPAKINGSTKVVESDNWHFYHQIQLRHDKAHNGWIKVVLNEQPQHRRSVSADQPNNPTQPAGNYWELLTRFYVDGHPYFDDPEIGHPVSMLVDDIKLTYVPTQPDLIIDIVGRAEGEVVDAKIGTNVLLPVKVTNSRSVAVCGQVSVGTFWRVGAKLLDSSGADLSGNVCLGPNSTDSWTLSLSPTGTSVGTVRNVGVTFVNDEFILSDSTSTNRSWSDGNVEKRWSAITGPHDAVVSSAFIQAKL